MTAAETRAVTELAMTVAARHAARNGWTGLALAESRRILAHPAFVVGVLLVAVPWAYQTVLEPETLQYVVLHQASWDTQLPMLLVAAGSFLAAAAMAGRSRRFGTEDLYRSLGMPCWHRRAALLAATACPAAVATALTLARLASLAAADGAVGSIVPAEVLTVTAVVLLAGMTGVAAGSLLRSVAGGAVSLALIGIATIAALLSTAPVRWLAPVAAENPFTTVVTPSALTTRPAWWHVLWLLALGAAIAAATLWSAGLARSAGAIALLVAVLLACAAGWRQLDAARLDPETALVVARTSPSSIQRCEDRGPVTYCAFDGFEPWIDAWHEVVSAELARAPGEVTVRRWAVRQQLPARSDDFEPRPLPWEALAEDNRLAGTPDAVPVSTRWAGAGSGDFDETEVLALAIQVAMRLTGVTPPTPTDGAEACGARGAVAYWLAFPSGGRAAAALDTDDGRRSGGIAGVSAEVLRSGFGTWIGPGERELGEQMVAADGDELRGRIHRSWAILTDPATTVDEAAELLSLPGPTVDYQGFICS